MIQKILEKKYLKRHSFLTVVFFLFSLNAFSATWYVNTTGSDANTGTTAGDPFLTIQKAINSAASGDVVTIATGTYNKFVLVTKNITLNIDNASVTVKSLVLNTASVNATITSSTTAGNLLITDSFELTDGLVMISGTTPPALKIKSGAKLVGGNKNSYVDGGYWIGSTNGSAITWHVGSGSDYRPINATSFTKLGSTEEFYFARVLANGPAFTQTLPVLTRNISKVHHYYMNTTATNTVANNFIIKFSYDTLTNDDHVYDFANLQLLTSTGSAAWVLNKTVGTANRLGTISSLSITNLAGYYVLGNKIGSQASGYLGGMNTLGSSEVFSSFIVVNQCEGDTIKFFSTSKSIGSAINNYTWDFGDGSPTTTGATAWHVYARGTPATATYIYLVSLKVENLVNIDFGYKNVTIINTPRVPLNANIFTQSVELLPKIITSVCQGQTTRITDTYSPPTGEVMSKKIWTITPVLPTFSRGNVSPYLGYKDSTKINYKFLVAGTFKIYITRVNQNNCRAIDSQDYVLHAKPTVGIDVIDQCWDPLKSVAINNITADPTPDKMLKWAWDLGDGTKLNGQATPMLLKTVYHKYATPGPRLIKLSVTTDADCKDSSSKIVNLFAKPVAGFSTTKTCIGEITNTLNNSSVASPEVIQYDIWNWGDGSPYDSAMPNSAHTFAKIGLYKILLEVQSFNLCKDTQLVWVRVHPKPTPAYGVKEACFGDSTRFRRLLNFKYPRQDSMYWNWTFDDTIMATDTAVRFKFTAPGVHKARLVGTSKAGCQDSSLGIFQVYYKPQPTFSLDPSVIPNDSMQCLKWNKFTFIQNYGGNPNDTILKSKWVWGDTFIQIPASTLYHSYDTMGIYQPRLIVTNIHGCADSITQTVKVVASPIAHFAYKGLCMPDSAYFYDTLTYSSDTIKQRYWDYGNGVKDSNILKRNVFFKTAGPFNASYIVKTKNGCSDTAYLNVNTLVNTPVISWNMSGSIPPLCKGDSTKFTITGGDSIIWQTDNDSVFVKYISKTGNYLFKVYNKGVCFAIDSVNVAAYPPANIKAHSDTTIFRGRKAFVYVSNALKNFHWYPGNYVADSVKVGTSTKQLTDSITLFVIATDSNGCVDLDSVHIRVIDPPLVKIPNIITPNGDKSNEYWDLIEIPDVFLFDIVISDRQGKRVYSSNNYLNNWNGIDSDGKVLPNGVYFYYMKNRQSKEEYRGYIQVIR